MAQRSNETVRRSVFLFVSALRQMSEETSNTPTLTSAIRTNHLQRTMMRTRLRDSGGGPYVTLFQEKKIKEAKRLDEQLSVHESEVLMLGG